MTKAYEQWGDLERDYLKESIYLEEENYFAELEYQEWLKNVNFEVKKPRKPNSKYGRAKISTRKSPIRKILHACKYKSTSL